MDHNYGYGIIRKIYALHSTVLKRQIFELQKIFNEGRVWRKLCWKTVLVMLAFQRWQRLFLSFMWYIMIDVLGKVYLLATNPTQMDLSSLIMQQAYLSNNLTNDGANEWKWIERRKKRICYKY